MVLIERMDGDETYSFPSRGRERWFPTMSRVGYVEFEAFKGKESQTGYWCRSCPYMKDDYQSPTGYICKKYSFPDEPWGCCGGWEPMPNVSKRQQALRTAE